MNQQTKRCYYYGITAQLAEIIKSFGCSNMKKAVVLIIWIVCCMAIWTLAATLVSTPNTFLALTGIAIMLAFFVISVKTKCFTIFLNLTFKKEKK